MDEYKRRRRRSRAVMSMFLDSLGGSIDNVDVATFDSDGTDLKALVVSIESIQDLHGYNNPWPAGGGKNKLQITEDTSSDNGITYTVQKNDVGEVIGIKAFGTATETSIWRCNYNVPVDTSKEYYLYSGVTGDSFGTYAVQINTDPGEATLNSTQNGRSPVISPVDGQQYLVRIVVWQGQKVDLVFKPMLLESSVTDTSFAPYFNLCPISGHSSVNVIVSPTLNPLDGTITNIPLGTTVYGGTRDVLTGVLTVNRRYTTIGAENVTKVIGSNYATFQLSFGESDKPKVDQANAVCISSAFKGYSFNDAPASDDNYLFANNSGAICVKNTANAGLTSAEWKTLMADVQLCYELATPTTIQLTGQQISTFLGTNNVWCDSGKIIHLEY